MKKILSIMFLVLMLFSAVGCAEKKTDELEKGKMTWDRIPAIMVDDVLYITTGRESTAEGRCGTWDGEITSECSGSELPTENDQSNFGTGYGYQYGERKGTVEVLVDGHWIIFATEEVKKEMTKELS